jgi:hypothetical protein
MNCEEFREKMFLYPEVDEDFFLHLQSCEECKKEFDKFLQIEKIIKDKIYEEEIRKEWERISFDIFKRLRLEVIKRKILTIFLIFLELIFSFLFIFVVYIFLKVFSFDFSFISLVFKGFLALISQLNSYLFLLTLILFVFYTEFNKRSFR